MKKIIASVLAAIFVIAAAAACAKPNSGNTDDTTKKNSDVTTGADEEPRFYDNLDFEGAKVNIATRDNATSDYSIGIEGGDVIYSSIYQSNETVNGLLNITREFILGSDDTHRFVTQTVNEILTGDCLADTVLVDQYFGTSFAAEGPYANILSDDYKGYLDLDQDWWYKDYMDHTAIGKNTAFFLGGDCSPSILCWAACSFVDLNLYEDVIGDPGEFLDKVEEGKWTLDLLFELSKTMYLDLDEDEMVSGKDRLGFAVVRGQSALFAGVCAGMKFTERDSDGNYSIVVDREENFDIFSKLYTLYNDTEGVFTYNEGTTDYHAKKVFADGRSLFCNEYVLSTWDETLRNMTNEFAVIPRPKNNEDQKEYITVLQDSFLLYTIPSCISLDKVPVVTAMIEAQGIINNRDVIPAIFDTALKSKFRSDLVDYEQASRLIELVRSGITTDFGVVYDNSLNNIANLVGRLIMNRSNNYASEIAGNITLFQTSLEDLMMAFEQLR